MGRLCIRLVSVFFCLSILPSVFSLKCYECENKAGTWCTKPKVQTCNANTHLCMKYVHKEGKPGFPNKILAKCELRSYYIQSRINACERSVRKRTDALTVSETCTCDTDLCNDASLDMAKMMEAETPNNNKESTPPPTDAPEHDEGDGGDDEGEGDAAVHSPNPEVKQMDDDSVEDKKVVATAETAAGTTAASDNGAKKTAMQGSHGVAMIIIQLILFVNIAARW